MTVAVAMTRLLQNARINLPGALDSALELELFNVLDEFFTDSRCWLQDITFPTVVDQTEYTLTPTASTGSIISLMYVQTAELVSVRATMPVPPVLELTSDPSQVETLTARVALTVVEPLDADGYPNIPAWLLQKYGQGLMYGVVGKMMTQAAKPYTNERMAVYHTRKFRAVVAKARAESRHENLYGGQTWRFPHFA